MQELTMSLEWDASATTVPNLFIDKYMPDANPAYSIVYLFLLRHATANKKLSRADAAEKLGLLESDIIKALTYWDSVGILRLSEVNGEAEVLFPYNRTFEAALSTAAPAAAKPIDSPSPGQAAVGGQPDDSAAAGNRQKPVKPRLIASSRPQYSVDELEVYKKSCADIDRLFACAESALGKLLSFNDLSVIFGLYDWLRLPVDVIGTLLEYCAGNGHRSLRYIEKVAIDWAENEINTIEKARSYIEVYNRDYRDILKAFGQSRREPSQAEITIMKKWINEYKMPIDVIIAACDKTILAIGQPKFAYADSIIESWHGKGIRTLEAVNAAQERYYKEKIEATRAGKDNKTAVRSGGNRFINFKQRQWDYEELEKLEREYIESNLVAKG